MFSWIRGVFVATVSGLSKPAAWFTSWFNGGTETDSGITLNEKNVIGWAPVWYAVSRISGHLCTLPITPMRRLDRGAEKDRIHQAYRLVRKRANPFMSAAVFWETFAAHALLFGNGKAVIVRNGSRLSELVIVNPLRSVTVYVNGEKWHCVQIDEDDRVSRVDIAESYSDREWIKIRDREVLHLPGLGLEGGVGLCVYEVSNNTFGIGLGAEKAVSKDFENGSEPGILLTAPKGVLRDQKDADEFMQNFNKFHSGLSNRNKAALMREGITASTLGGSNRDAQWVEQRTFQRQEVALLFGLESILGDDDSTSYNSAEQKDLAYLKNTLAKWLVKIEQECDEKLLTTRQKREDSHFFKYNTAALLRTDFKSTIDALSLAISARIMSPNEARERLDMNPYEGGDDYENPNITPGPSSDPDSSGGAAENRAVEAQMRHVIGIECHQVIRASKKPDKFLTWTDLFYDSKFLRTLEDTVVRFGGDPSIARDYCEESKNQLLDLTGEVSAENLASGVVKLTSQWPDRAGLLADQVTGELANV